MKKSFTGPQSEVNNSFSIFQPFTLADSQLRIWTAAEVSQDDYVALLMCVAVDGYHSLTSYQWRKDGENILNEIYPLFYATTIGSYDCFVSAMSQTAKCSFEVKGVI